MMRKIPFTSNSGHQGDRKGVGGQSIIVGKPCYSKVKSEREKQDPRYHKVADQATTDAII